MKRFRVEVPPPVPGEGLAELGRLGPALERLARLQGAWPPVVPRSVRTLVVHEGVEDGVDGAAPDDDGGTASDGAARRPADVARGAAEAEAAADAGVDLLVVGASGDQVPGLVAAAVLLGMEPVEAVVTVAGPDWAARAVGVRRGVVACRAHRRDPDRLLEALASPVVGRLVGLLAQSAVRRTPVVLDGSPLVLGAGLVAARLAPGAQRWWLAGQAATAPAASRALTSLGLDPLLDLGLERPEGATLAYSLLAQGIELVRG